MSYFCDIYENIRILLSVCLLISGFLVIFSFWVDSVFHSKKLFFTGITGVVILTTVLVLLPSKSFVCGA